MSGRLLARGAVVAVVALAYAALFGTLHRLLGVSVGALSFVPVIAGGALLGRGGGLAVALAMIPIDLAAYQQAYPTLDLRAPVAGTFVVHSVTAFLVGWMRDLVAYLRVQRRRLERLNAELRASEARSAELTRRADEQHARLHALLDASPEAVIEYDLDGRIVRWNPAAQALLGWSADEVVGQHPPHVREGGEAVRYLISRIRSGETLRFEASRARKDGTLVPVDVSAAGVRDRSGQIVGVVALLVDLTERKRHEAELARLALHDPLTGLPNRTLLAERLEQALLRARDGGSPVTLMILDLDHFKDINDTLGHDVGDAVLLEIAGRLRAELRETETCARLGGDEFAVLLPTADASAAAAVAGRIIAAFGRPILQEGQALSVETSIGIAMFPEHGDAPTTLLRRADVALYAAKRERGTFTFYSEVDDPSLDQLTLAAQLRRAIAENDLVLHYQPKIELATGSVRGVEALVRWRHPERGLVPPAVFLPAAERGGVIALLTEWVMRAALRQAAAWRGAGFEVPVAVNVPPRLLLDERFARTVGAELDRSGLPGSMLELEITERGAMRDGDRVAVVLGDLEGQGVRVSIDDFGTGSSSLAHLRQLPLRALKIDRSFVAGVVRSEHDRAIVRASIGLARELGMTAVAEGIEEEAVAEQLRAMGCEMGQGFGIAPPMPFTDLIAWLTARSGPDRVRITHDATLVLALAESAAAGMVGDGRTEWLERLEREEERIELAFAAFIGARDGERAQRLAADLKHFWLATGRVEIGSRHVHDALALPGAAPRTRARALCTAGVLAGNVGRDAQAETFFTEALALFEEHEDAHGIACCTSNLGVLASERRSFAEADRRFARSLALRTLIGDRWGVAAALNNLGVSAIRQRHWKEAEGHHEAARQLRTELRDDGGVALSFVNLGVVDLARDDLASAAARFRTAIETYARLPVRGENALAIEGGAIVAARLGDHATALELVSAARAIRARHAGLSFADEEALHSVLVAIDGALDAEEARACRSRGEALGGEQVRELMRRVAADAASADRLTGPRDATAAAEPRPSAGTLGPASLSSVADTMT